MAPQSSNEQEDIHETQEGPLREPLLPDGPVEEVRRRKPSRNVILTLLYTIFAFSGRSIWSQSVLAAYVYLLRNNQAEAVGFITAVLGLSQLVTSIPAGIIADAHRRDVLLKFSSTVGCFAVGVTFWACWRESYVCLVLALAVWGLYYGVTNTTLGALFADSIPLGDRSYYFTQRASLLSLGNVCGPAVSLVLFFKLGDNWTVRDCSIVMAVGQCVCFPAILVLCFFNDKYAVDINRETQEERYRNQEEQEEPLLIESDHEVIEDHSTAEEEEGETTALLFWKPCLAAHRLIPAQIATADIISGLASGMSIRYFPIFFVDNLRLSPVEVQVLYICSPLGMALLMRMAQRLSSSYGRLHVVVLHKWIGIALMIAMMVAYLSGLSKATVCALYVLRTAFMNSTGALTRSTLMDHVPSSERGKWSALESVNMFSWSGSAALGGVLVGICGLLPVFGVTAFLQFVATWPLMMLFRYDVTEGSEASLPGRSPVSRQQSLVEDSDEIIPQEEQVREENEQSRTPQQV